MVEGTLPNALILTPLCLLCRLFLNKATFTGIGVRTYVSFRGTQTQFNPTPFFLRQRLVLSGLVTLLKPQPAGGSQGSGILPPPACFSPLNSSGPAGPPQPLLPFPP